MATHIDFGKLGEKLAVDFLITKAIQFCTITGGIRDYEIDIVALKDEVPHFIEVKTRSSNQFGEPEESVSKKKIRFLLQAADEFLFQNPQYKNFQIDILSITIHTQQEPQYFFIEDVYL